jgi:hypothetical protein
MNSQSANALPWLNGCVLHTASQLEVVRIILQQGVLLAPLMWEVTIWSHPHPFQ